MDFILFPIAPAHDVCFQFRIEECLLWGQAVWTACILRTFIFSFFFFFLSFRWSLKIWNFMVEHTHTHAHWAQHSMEHLNELQFSAEFLHIPRFFFFHRNLFELNAWLTGWPNKKKMAGRSRLEYVFARFMGAHNPGERQTDIGPWHSFVCILLFTVILLEIWPFTVRLHWKRNPFNLYTFKWNCFHQPDFIAVFCLNTNIYHMCTRR